MMHYVDDDDDDGEQRYIADNTIGISAGNRTRIRILLVRNIV